jgi:hypothetical protein
MTISAQEQLLIELINRARLDPLAEAARLGIDLNQGLSPGELDGSQKQPLASNALLAQAAEGHSQWMLDADVFSHTGISGTNPGQRMTAAGYVFAGSWHWGENISWWGTTGRLDLTAAMNTEHDALFVSPHHRLNILNDSYREIGVAQVVGAFRNGNVTYTNTSMVTENFGVTGTAVFLTGVTYDDRDGDRFYDVGEARSDLMVTVASQGAAATARTSGGYEVALQPGGMAAVTLQSNGQTTGLLVSLGGGNVKLDVVYAAGVPVLLSTADLVLTGGAITAAQLIGQLNVSLTGDGQANLLTGNKGDNLLSGGGGDDTLSGGAGTDTAVFGVASTTVAATATADGLVLRSAEGSDLVRADVEYFAFSDRTLTRAEAARLTGQTPPVSLIGTDGDDRLEGAGGNDTLIGNDGNDTLYGQDGQDRLNGGAGDDLIYGGASDADLRDLVFGGDGNDTICGGGGQDELYGGGGHDSVSGDFGADTLIGNEGDDWLTGGPGADALTGGPGDDWLNGGFGHDRLNGGAGADRFYHAGLADHGSDWIQDYTAADGDVLLFGLAGATADQFRISYATTPGAGQAEVAEAFVIYRPTGQIVWALVDGAAQPAVMLQIGGQLYDLVA